MTTTTLQHYTTIHCSTYNQFVPHRERTLFSNLTYLLSYLIGYFCTILLNSSTQHIPLCYTNRYSASQEIPLILCNPKVHSHIHNSPPPVPMLSQINSVRVHTSHFLNFHFIIILILPCGFFPSVSPPKSCIPFSTPLNPSMPHQPHSPFYHTKNIWWAVQIIKQYRSLSSTDH